MTLIALVNTSRVTLATDELVVPAEQVRSLTDAIEAARELSSLHERESARLRAAEEEARERGWHEGFAEGDEKAAERLSERLVTLGERAEREREALRRQATGNALDIVRRIAATLGEADTLAALAAEAARELIPSGGVTVQVRPDMVEPVRARLAVTACGQRSGQSGEIGGDAGVGAGEDVTSGPDGEHAFAAALVVVADDSLEPGQCRLRGGDGLAVLAGLETQLRNLERLVRRRAIVEPGTSAEAPREILRKGVSATSETAVEAPPFVEAGRV